jgi:hypothetical protein
MAASSQYHRGATTPSSHYQPIASSHEHLYSDIATTWNNSHVLSSRSPPPSALLQRFSLPVTAQRSFPAHGFNYANPPSDYVNNQQQTQASWTANYFRPGPSEWSDGPLGDETYAGRPLSYHDEGARTAPMPHHQHHPSHQHQDATDAAHIVLLPGHQYRPAEHQQQDQLPAVSVDSAKLRTRRSDIVLAAFRSRECPTIPATGSKLSSRCTSSQLSKLGLARQSSACTVANSAQLASCSKYRAITY